MSDQPFRAEYQHQCLVPPPVYVVQQEIAGGMTEDERAALILAEVKAIAAIALAWRRRFFFAVGLLVGSLIFHLF